MARSLEHRWREHERGPPTLRYRMARGSDCAKTSRHGGHWWGRLSCLNKPSSLSIFVTSRALPKARSFVNRLGDALSDIGFFAVTHHGVDQALIKQAYAQARFFELPAETKAAYEDLARQRALRATGKTPRQRRQRSWSFGTLAVSSLETPTCRSSRTLAHGTHAVQTRDARVVPAARNRAMTLLAPWRST